LNWGVSVLRRAVEKANHRHGWLAARRDRPRRRTTEQRYELAASHCPMPPVLPTERIAHIGTADCCIRPPGRNEMIAITPPKIFSKEVAQNRPPTSPSLPEIVSDHISGDGAWMNVRISRVLPTRERDRAWPSPPACLARVLCAYAPAATLACSASSKGRAMR